MGKMIIPVDNKAGDGQLIVHGILRVYAEHHIGRIVGDPGPRVVCIVFRIERFVADETVEQTRLHCQTVPDRSQIGHVGSMNVAQGIRAADLRLALQERKIL